MNDMDRINEVTGNAEATTERVKALRVKMAAVKRPTKATLGKWVGEALEAQEQMQLSFLAVRGMVRGAVREEGRYEQVVGAAHALLDAVRDTESADIVRLVPFDLPGLDKKTEEVIRALLAHRKRAVIVAAVGQGRLEEARLAHDAIALALVGQVEAAKAEREVAPMAPLAELNECGFGDDCAECGEEDD